MNFKNKNVKTNNSKYRIKAIISFSNNVFYAVTKTGMYELDGNGAVIGTSRNLYSLPNNDKHKAWYEFNVTSTLKRLDVINKYWASVKDGMKIKGKIYNNKFVIL